MTEINPELRSQLEQSPAARALAAELEPSTPGTAASTISRAEATHLTLDHYVTSGIYRLHVRAGGDWRYCDVDAAGEQGIAQLAFMSDIVEAEWDENNHIRLLRCWKRLA